MMVRALAIQALAMQALAMQTSLCCQLGAYIEISFHLRSSTQVRDLRERDTVLLIADVIFMLGRPYQFHSRAICTPEA